MDVSSSTRPAVPPSSGSLQRLLQRYPLVSFFVLALSLSWLAWIPFILSQSGLGILPISLDQFAVLPGAFLGPFVSGFIMTAVTEGKPGVRRLLRRFVLWRVSWYWYLFALIGIPALRFLGMFVLPGSLEVFHTPDAQFVVLFLLVLVLQIFTSGLAEEPGWRGFALPRLQERSGPLLGSVILGVLWGCWHIPLFLTNWGTGGSAFEIVGFIVVTSGMAIIMTWVFNHTQGSLLMAILVHAAVNTLGSVAFMTDLFAAEWMLAHGTLAQLITFGVPPLLLIIVTRGRLGYQRISSDEESAIPVSNDARS